MGMKFKVADLQRELRFIEKIAAKYLERGSEGRLSEVAGSLDFIVHDKARKQDWQIDHASPLRTIPSWGHCEVDGRGRFLQGSLSFVWTLRGAGKNTVELVDKASTVLTIQEIERSDGGYRLKHAEDEYLQQWHIDVVADSTAPGPGVHVQFSNHAEIPVPRLPTLLLSPADCLDFLLGELFQTEWPHHQAGHNQIQSFAELQRKRLQRFLREQASWLDNVGERSAWTALKNERLADNVFLAS